MPEVIPRIAILRLRLPIHDMLALIVGYGMAALFFRAFWPMQGLPGELITPAVAFYAWLGLAMSSPALLSQSRWSGFQPTDQTARRPFTTTRTGSELAWLWIGIYWIILALFVIPTRLSQFGVGDTVLLALLPSMAVVVSRYLGPARGARHNTERAWTKSAAIAVVGTWPLAWICLMILGQTVISSK